MSWNVDFSIGGGRRPVERIDERIIVTPGREIIEETITRGPYRERYEETIISGPRREIIEERVVVGPGRREVIEERIIVDRPGDSYRRHSPPPPYCEREKIESRSTAQQGSIHFIGNPVLPVKVTIPKPSNPLFKIGKTVPGRVLSQPTTSYPATSYGRTTTTSYPGSSYGKSTITTRSTDSFYGWVPPSHCRGTITWVECYNGQVPSDPVHAGVDKDNAPIYAGRAWHDGDLLPAKICPSHGCAYISYGGNEIRKDRYEVMCSRHVAWQYDADGRVPAEAIVCGHTSSGERLYMGRCMHDGTMTVGKIHPSHHCIYIPYGGREISYKQYEVLVLS